MSEKALREIHSQYGVSKLTLDVFITVRVGHVRVPGLAADGRASQVFQAVPEYTERLKLALANPT